MQDLNSCPFMLQWKAIVADLIFAFFWLKSRNKTLAVAYKRPYGHWAFTALQNTMTLPSMEQMDLLKRQQSNNLKCNGCL